MANNLLQSSQKTETTTPGYYTDYLSNLAKEGKSAVNPLTGAQFVDANKLQTTAFDDVNANTGLYSTDLSDAQATLGNAGTSSSPLSAASTYLASAMNDPSKTAQQYMNPYITSVVNALGDVGQRNIMQNLAPGAVACSVGGGQFGSKRGAEVLGQTLSNANRDILNKQYEALGTGYNTALNAATTQNQIANTAGATAANAANVGQQNLTTLGGAQSSLAGQNQALALNRLNALSTLGAQKQTIAQNKELFPLQNLTTLSGLLRGYTTPTTTKTTAEMSPLSALGAVGAGTAGLFQGTGANSSGPSVFQQLTGGSGTSILNQIKNAIGGNPPIGNTALPSGMTQEQITAAQNGWVQQPDGSYVDSEGNPV